MADRMYYLTHSILLCSLLIGCKTSHTPSKSSDVEIVGTWYLNQIYGSAQEAFRDVTPSITLRSDGSYVGVDMVGGEDEGTFEWNARDMTITITEEGRTGKLRVALIDDVMLMTFVDLPEGDSEEWQGVIFEFSRSKSGNERHQAIRQLQRDLPVPSEIERSNENLRVLIDLIMDKYEDNGGRMPRSLGELAISGEVEIDRLFVPWIRHREPLPKKFNSLSRDKKIGWLSTYSSYTYLYGERFDYGPQLKGDGPHLILFELSSLGEKEPETVGMAFSDRSVRRVPISEASRILKEQTEWTLAEWKSLQ